MSDMPKTDALLNETATMYPDAEHNALVALARDLERENAALRKDKERLDWVSQHGGWLTFVPTAPEGTWRCKGELTRNRAGFGENARDAIDAAMKEVKP